MEDELLKLSEWLECPVYETGVLLYEQLLGPSFLLTILKAGVDEYNRHKLSEALQQRYDEVSQQLAQRKAAYPDSLKVNLATGGTLMDERIILKEKMRGLWERGIQEGDELKTMALRVLDIGQELDQIYGEKDFFHQHGYLPEQDSQVTEKSLPELLTRRNTLRTYVSREQKRLAKITDESEYTKTSERLADFRRELFAINTQLDAFQNQ